MFTDAHLAERGPPAALHPAHGQACPGLLWFPRFEGVPMFQEIRDLLTTAEVARLTQLSRELPFVEGRLSNPNNISKVNLQSDQGDPRYPEAAKYAPGEIL